MTQHAEKKTRSLIWILKKYYMWVIPVVLVVGGSYGVVEHLLHGTKATALSSYVPWGLGVSVYVFLVWLEVGSLTVFSVLYYSFGWKTLKPLKLTVFFVGFALLSMALVTIAMDLGRMFKLWRVFSSPNFQSPMTWMIWLHTAYMMILLAEIWAAWTKREKMGVWLYGLSLPVAILLASNVGALFGINAARPLWNAALLPLHFLIASLLAGTALVAVQIRFFSRGLTQEQAKALIIRLRPFLLGFLGVGVYAATTNALIIIVPHAPASMRAFHLALFGPYWWSFWVLHILGGVIIPGLILVLRKSARSVVTASVLIVAGFSALPPNIIIPALADEGILGLARAFQDARLNLNYFPNFSEWLLVGFVTGMGWLIFLVAQRLTDKYDAHPVYKETERPT